MNFDVVKFSEKLMAWVMIFFFTMMPLFFLWILYIVILNAWGRCT